LKIIADFGNTSLKIGFSDNSEIFNIKEFENNLKNIENIKSFISKNTTEKVIYCACVNPFFKNILLKDNYNFVHIDNLWMQDKNNEIGEDISAMAFYFSNYKKNNLIFSLGTTNLGIISSSNKIINIFISSGINVSMSSLISSTHKINIFPKINNLHIMPINNTKSSMISGAYFQTYGYINEIINYAKKNIDNNISICFTGGNFKKISHKYTSKNYKIIDNLVLKGLAKFFK